MKETLVSISQQTEKPDLVAIGYSGPRNIQEEKIWDNILSPIKLEIEYREEKILQFQHYFNLLKYVNNDDIVMFCDNGDLYDNNKVKVIKNIFNTNPKYKIINHPIKYFDDASNVGINDIVRRTNEHVCIVLQGFLFKLFFDHHPYSDLPFIEIIKKYRHLTDLYFLVVMYSYTSKEIFKSIDNILYYKRLTWTAKDY